MDEKGTARGFIAVTPNAINHQWEFTATDFTFFDDLLRYLGSTEGIVATWAERNGCTTPREFRIEPDIVKHKYRGCDRRSSTVLYTVEGGGHTWPDGLIDLPQFGPTTRTINATDLILELFASI